MSAFPCPNCGTDLEVRREGFDGPPLAFHCPNAKCGADFLTSNSPPSDVQDDPPPNALCGCRCGCDVPLSKGNCMAFTDDLSEEDAVQTLVCLNCYIGAHKAAV